MALDWVCADSRRRSASRMRAEARSNCTGSIFFNSEAGREFVAVNLHHAGGEYAGLRFAQCRLELVDDVIHRGEFLVALDRGRVVVRGFSQVGHFVHERGANAGGLSGLSLCPGVC